MGRKALKLRAVLITSIRLSPGSSVSKSMRHDLYKHVTFHISRKFCFKVHASRLVTTRDVSHQREVLFQSPHIATCNNTWRSTSAGSSVSKSTRRDLYKHVTSHIKRKFRFQSPRDASHHCDRNFQAVSKTCYKQVSDFIFSFFFHNYPTFSSHP